MKTPWKFLAQLASRRRPIETPESSVGDDADRVAGESGIRQTSALSSNSTEVSGGADHDDNPAVDPLARPTSAEPDSDLNGPPSVSRPRDGEGVQSPARHETSRSLGDTSVQEGRPSGKSPQTPRTKRLGRTKTPRADLVSKSTAVARSDQGAQSSSRRDGFFDEVTSLDEEIRQLRSQLAHKLRLQNVQLEKMLERFDGS
ncbi:hypothetical protein EV129_105346 [Rhizobium azibense]|uniref:Uncharacterized protein n=1 Tax=Rhizobium azibense TaxID=1136135 RepID=A0A4R3RTB1_9HYPH|nr:hypothetical protein EV129_105346 [Rhizobium azibense]